MSIVSLSKFPQQLKMGQAETRNPKLNLGLPYGWEGPRCLGPGSWFGGGSENGRQALQCCIPVPVPCLLVFFCPFWPQIHFGHCRTWHLNLRQDGFIYVSVTMWQATDVSNAAENSLSQWILFFSSLTRTLHLSYIIVFMVHVMGN